MSEAERSRPSAWPPFARPLIGALQTAVTTVILGAAFGGMFDMAMLATTWEHLHRGAILLARDAAGSVSAGDDIDRLFATAEDIVAPADVIGSGRVTLRLLNRDGLTLQDWQRGPFHTRTVLPARTVCPSGRSFAVELAIPTQPWLLAPGVIGRIFPEGLRAHATACARTDRDTKG